MFISSMIDAAFDLPDEYQDLPHQLPLLNGTNP
jgi:hypothetical protein